MIIDVHYHLIPAISEEAARNLADGSIRHARTMGRSLDKATATRRCLETFADPTGERMIAHMEEAGIDLTVICAVDNRDNGVSVEMIQAHNKLLTDICRRHPKRVLALAGVDPRRPEAADMLKQCFEEYGVVGLKYHPDYGYNPSGPESYKLLEIVNKHSGVLLTHCGAIKPPGRPKFADAMLLSDIGADFPNLKVIAAHMGHANWRSWANLACYQPNFYGDMAEWDALAFGHYDLFCRELRDLIDRSHISKVLFGADSPIFDFIEPAKNYIKLIKNLPENAPAGIKFTKTEIDAILGGNATRVLGLS
jgi:uncharacterized protein